MKKFIPKGGMCANCQHKNRNCRDLPFSEMTIIGYDDDCYLVKCVDFLSERDLQSASRLEVVSHG